MRNLSTKFTSVIKTGALVVVTAGLLVSCAKESIDTVVTPSKEITDKSVRRKLDEAARNLPKVGIYNKTMEKIIVFDLSNPQAKSFTFVDPGPGVNFASSNGGEWVYFPESGEFVVLSEPGGFGGAGGGTVVAGGTSLNIDIAFCFSASEEAIGGDLFGGDGFGDVAGVIGIAGDFEALANEEFGEDEDPFDYFEGLAYYFVWTDELANTSYDVIEFFEAEEGDPEENEDLAFAWLVSLQGDGGIYLSADGEISISGASMSFNGEYFGIEGIGFFEDGEGEDWEYVEVPGFGTMSCSE